MIVRWSLGELADACAEAGVRSPLLVASPRWDGLELPVARARPLERGALRPDRPRGGGGA